MKKRKIAIISFLAFGIVVLAAFIVIGCSTSPKYIIPVGSAKYHTKEELVDLYWKNTTVLNSVKDSVLSNAGFLQVLVDQKDGDAGIHTEVNKDLFSEEEWVNIVSVFENLHPYMIMMERKGMPLKFYINFADLKLETGSKRTSLYWFPNEDEIAYHKKHSLADSVEYTQVDGCWYIVEEKFHWQ